jgi:acetylornithine deacetylase/succinyl-diaminopimelate desuccinylase-like protein
MSLPPPALELPRDLEEEAVTLLADLVRIDTSNPPGRERPAAERCAEALRRDGLDPLLLEGAPGRTNLLCRWKGTGARPPLMLTAHLDVVPAGDGWLHPPFGAEIHDGFLWGRGAVDMKHHAAACVTVLRTLARAGRRLARDVLLVLVADEEAGCTWGSEWLVANHPELVRAEYALGEIGGFTLRMGKTRLYPIQVAQKGAVWIRARTRGPSGHGSMPKEGSAVGRLAAALGRLARSHLPYHTPRTTRDFLEEVARHVGGPRALALRAMASPALAPRILARLPDRSLARSLHAVLANTAVPTILRAGERLNVIPTVAEADLDTRTLPGDDGAAVFDELRAILGEGVELEVIRSLPALETRSDTPMYEALADAIRRADPGGVPVPYMIPGFTDGFAFAKNGTVWYGFAPIRFPEEPPVRFAELYHNANERIPVDGFRWGVRVLLDAVCSFASAPG